MLGIWEMLSLVVVNDLFNLDCCKPMKWYFVPRYLELYLPTTRPGWEDYMFALELIDSLEDFRRSLRNCHWLQMSFKSPFQKKNTTKTKITPPNCPNSQFVSSNKISFFTKKHNKKYKHLHFPQEFQPISGSDHQSDHPTIIQKKNKSTFSSFSLEESNLLQIIIIQLYSSKKQTPFIFARRLDRSLFRSWLVLFTKEIPWTIPSRRSEATRRFFST